MASYRFSLYLARGAPGTGAAEAALRAQLDRALGKRYQLRVIDVLTDPAAAEREGVLAVPTVVKERPLPRRGAFGDLTDARLLAALGVGE